jgi:Rhs element Vgr protein
MMLDSPMDNSSGVIKLTILAAGKQIDEAIDIASVAVTRTVNKIPYARIEMLDGDMPGQDFPVSNSDAFKPGSEIEIKAGYGDSEESIFKGIIVRHGIKITGDNYSRLIIECRDKALKMTIGRKNANFVKMKDSDIIASLCKTNHNLAVDVEATTIEFEELVQYYCTDWDFLLSRAEVNGLLVLVDDASVSVKKPQVSGAAVLKLTYGADLIELHADIDARSQFSQVSAVSWDPKTQKIVEQKAAPQTLNEHGDLKSGELASIAGPDSFCLQSSGLIEQSALTNWAEAQQVKSGLARIRGRMKFQGSAKAIPGSLIELAGVGDHFNGDVFVSSVNHQISAGNWVSEVDFGMSPDWFAEQRDLVAPPASGWLPGVEGLQIGVVMKLDEDPNGESRVQVAVPILQAESEGVWARLANFHASAGFGGFFIPEIGDEVILGYLNNDPSNPVILGSLYSSKMAPPYELTSDNFTKAIVTRSKLRIEFDEDKKITTIITPAENKIVLNDDEKSILMQDQNDNKVELSPDGIVLDSPKDISITASGKISIEATGAIDVSSQADVSVKGMNVNHEAQVGFVAKGNASAELSASGQTTVKGAMVMIN